MKVSMVVPLYYEERTIINILSKIQDEIKKWMNLILKSSILMMVLMIIQKNYLKKIQVFITP